MFFGIDFKDFHFLRPLWLFALPFGVLFAWWLWRRGLRVGEWRNICDAHLLPYLLMDNDNTRKRYPFVVFALLWCVAVLALSGPAWQRLEQPLFQKVTPTVIVLDMSASMNAADVEPSRLGRAKYKVADLLNARAEDNDNTVNADGQWALIVFAGDAHVVYPLTDDVNSIFNLLPVLETDLIPLPGGRASSGLRLAADLLRQTNSINGKVVLITDGVDAAAAAAAVEIKDMGARLDVLAIGTRAGAPIVDENGGFLKDHAGSVALPGVDFASLEHVAKTGGGEMVKMTASNDDVNQLLSQGFRDLTDGQATDSRYQSELWRDQGPWLVLLILPFAALAFRRGWLMVFVLSLFSTSLTTPNVAQAGWWESLWWRTDQQAASHYERQDFDSAAQTGTGSLWQGAAHYRAQDFESATEAFGHHDTAIAHYNRGNALAQRFEFQQALEAYEQTLALAPDHEDANWNRDLVKHLLEQQQQQMQQPQHGAQNRESGQQQNSEQQREQGQSNSGGDEQQSDDAGRMDGEDELRRSANEANSAAADQQPGQQQNTSAHPDHANNQGVNAQSDFQQGQSSEDLSSLDVAQRESRETIEQWLRRIPDDPGGLLRRKFYLEQRRRGVPHGGSEQPW